MILGEMIMEKNISKVFSISGLKIEMCVNFFFVLVMEEIVNIKEM